MNAKGEASDLKAMFGKAPKRKKVSAKPVKASKAQKGLEEVRTVETAESVPLEARRTAKHRKQTEQVSESNPGKKRFGGPQDGSGRPRKVIDLALVEKLAQIHASQEEIAAMLGVSVGYVSEHMKSDQAFADAHARGWSNGRLNLRRRQLEKAMGGDSTMLIWLGKNMLGQADKAEVKTHQTFSFVVDLS